MLGTSGAFANQCRKRKTFTLSDLEGGFRCLLTGQHALAAHQPLFDDIKVFNRAILRTDDCLAASEKAQLAMLHHKGQMVGVHQVERRVVHQKRHGAMYVLHNGRFAGGGEGVVLTHEQDLFMCAASMGRPGLGPHPT